MADTGFVGDFSIDNWTLSPNGGIIDTTQTPSKLILYNADNNTGEQNTTVLITSPLSGNVSFDWDVTNINSTYSLYWDPFIFIINNTNIVLTNGDDFSGSGSFNYSINVGDTFGFNAKTLDSIDGYYKNMILNFRFEQQQPTNPVIINNSNELLYFMNTSSTYANIINSLEINFDLITSSYKVLTGNNVKITKSNN